MSSVKRRSLAFITDFNDLTAILAALPLLILGCIALVSFARGWITIAPP
jgi:hypothetical protein